MLIEPPRHPQKITVTRRTCDYHKHHPWDVSYPGCTCGGEWILSDCVTEIPETGGNDGDE